MASITTRYARASLTQPLYSPTQQVFRAAGLRWYSAPSSATPTIQAGQPLPNLPLQFESPATELPAFDHFARFPRALLVGVPGAFTPGCSQSHLPGFISRAQALADLGVQQLGCVAVNDAFVMQAWAQSLLQSSKVGGKGEGTSGQATAVGPLPFQFLADPQAKLVGALGLSFDATAALGNWRARRFVLILENGVVREVLSEPDNVGITVTRASHVEECLRKLYPSK